MWLRSTWTPQQLSALSWQDFKDAFEKQFLPIDHARHARDLLAACQQTGSTFGYTNAFRRILV